ncbi:MAG: hypothetical protein A2Z25_19770 [Planctomycetes bacterium RBG_16_55_9]|nr:MAG: hypothetical protein A2Z25_19770 [Planctomycetes bacterium RBG_16_55_9]
MDDEKTDGRWTKGRWTIFVSRLSSLVSRLSSLVPRPSSLVQPGFTLVEAVMSMLIVGTMLVAALSTVGASRLSQYKTSRSHCGRLLAESLMAEILRQDYQEPGGAVAFGP